jgi:DNA-binding CsgD family transcriptional regulator
MQRALQTITQIIHAVGSDGFPSLAARALCELTSFELATIVVHRSKATPSLVFDNFASMGRQGLQNYISITHRLNPVLRHPGSLGAVRASDFRATPVSDRRTMPFFSRVAEEELGFLTTGWPAGMEELGLYFKAFGGVIEFCVYRERSLTPAANKTIQTLSSLCAPIAAAFNRHDALTRVSMLGDHLSPRETQVAELMLQGCDSEAIALRLQISRHTVKDYRKQIYRKLDITSLAELFTLSRHSPYVSPLWGDGLPMQ